MDDPDTNDHIEPSVFGEDDDDPFALPPPLASLAPPGEDLADVQAENGVLNLDGETETGQEDKQENKTKKRVPRPRVNLNEMRLCTNKGVAALKNLCDDVTFKGKGHEASDLNKLLQQFEHWAQCLMPRWPFENVVKKCEKLGTKRMVQNELKRLRRDEEDILRGDSEGEKDQEADEGETSATGQQPEQEPGVAAQETPVQYTDEQMERIRKNRELAFARREALKKRKLQTEESQNDASTVSETPGTTEDLSEDHIDNSNGIPFTMLGTDQNNIHNVDAAGPDKQMMNESPTRKPYQLDPNDEEIQIAETIANQMDTDTNVKEISAEPTITSPTRESNQLYPSNDDDDEIEGVSIDQMDMDTNTSENSVEQPTENREPVEKIVLNARNCTLDSVTEILIESPINIENFEIQRETKVLTEKPIMTNSKNEYPVEIIGVGQNVENTNAINEISAAELPVKDNGPSSETSTHSDKENEDVVVDEADHQMVMDLQETTRVKMKDNITTDNPDMKNGTTENQDITDSMMLE